MRIWHLDAEYSEITNHYIKNVKYYKIVLSSRRLIEIFIDFQLIIFINQFKILVQSKIFFPADFNSDHWKWRKKWIHSLKWDLLPNCYVQ